jgi:hypothetical protein
MKRFLVVLATAGALVTAAAVPAFAEAGPNDHNCEGSVNSEFTPQVVNHGQEGDPTSTRATEGGQASYVQGYNEPLANCGSTP